MKTKYLLAALGISASLACASAAPKIQFDSTIYDFGKTSQVSSVTGVFKFKNTGDAVLKLEPPQPSCGCTLAQLKSDTLQPGESGELPFTLNLGPVRATMEKQITVKSNDPQTPVTSLAIHVDYTPLYELEPMSLLVTFPLGTESTNLATTITRHDDKPLQIVRMIPSQPWLTAKLDPATKPDATSARVLLTARRDGPPRRFNELVHIYASDDTNKPVSTIYLYGQVMGEVTLAPESLYWIVTDPAKAQKERPEATVIRRLNIGAASGKDLSLKNLRSTLPDVHVELKPKDSGRSYELVATLDPVPEKTVSGSVSFDTSIAGQSHVEIPVIVNVFRQ